ncbi:MAG TPA: hypothetical protein VF527_12175 [Pyrinomonadaceae bacterium]
MLTLLVAAVIGMDAFKPHGNQVKAQDSNLQLPVIVSEQLQPENGIVPIEIRCGTAHLTAPDTLAKFSCKLKNRTNKNIIAATVAYSVVFQSDGIESADTRLHTLEAFIHSDLYNPGKSIQPQAERTIEPPGPMSYANSIIKRVEITVDYVEFEDTTTIGHNEKGSQQIASIREGATKYKKWLVQKYIKDGRKVESIIPLLQKNQSLVEALGNENLFQEQGAKAYRNYLYDAHNKQGAPQLERLLNK